MGELPKGDESSGQNGESSVHQGISGVPDASPHATTSKKAKGKRIKRRLVMESDDSSAESSAPPDSPPTPSSTSSDYPALSPPLRGKVKGNEASISVLRLKVMSLEKTIANLKPSAFLSEGNRGYRQYKTQTDVVAAIISAVRMGGREVGVSRKFIQEHAAAQLGMNSTAVYTRKKINVILAGLVAEGCLSVNAITGLYMESVGPKASMRDGVDGV